VKGSVDVDQAASLPISRPRRAPRPGLGELFRRGGRSFKEIRGNPFLFLQDLVERHGTVIRLPGGSHLIAHPDQIGYVLRTRYENFIKGRAFDTIRPVLGYGLVSADGELWRQQRRILQPAFHKHELAQAANVVSSCTGRMLDAWREVASRGEAMDVSPQMFELALHIITDFIFRTDVEMEARQIAKAFSITQEYAAGSLWKMARNHPRSPFPRSREYRRALEAIDAVVHDVLDKRREQGVSGNDVIARLLAFRHPETGEPLSRQQMRDEVMTLFFAGHETTASALAWSWWLISEHPEVEARIHEEVDRVLAGRMPSWDDLPQLQYTKQVLQESMRVRPPVPVYARVSVEEDEIAGYRIPPDTMVMISPYVTHRLPEFWPDPERFDPDRFALDRIQERPRFAYVPFAAGPRLCMGRNFALMEGTFVIAMVAQRYRLKLVPGHPIEMKTMATMRPRHGVRMTLHAR